MARQEVILQRREQVKGMMLARMSVRNIAKSLGWDPSTVVEDMRSIRSEYSKKERLEDGDQLTDILMRNEQQYQDAHKLQLKTDNEWIKLGCIRAKKELDRERLTMMQEFGITQKQLGNLGVRQIQLTFDMPGVTDEADRD